MVQHAVQRAIVPSLDSARTVCTGFGAGQIRCTEQRNDSEGKDKRDKHRNGERHRQRSEELPDDTFQQAQRREHDDRGDGRCRHGPEQLLHGIRNRLRPVSREAEMSDDILGDHHRIVDHQTNGNRERAKCHQIERLAEQRHQPDGDGEGERNDRRADGCHAPVAQEKQQHEYGERGTDQHRITH